MAKKLLIKGNYLIVEDTVTGDELEYPSKDVFYRDYGNVIEFRTLQDGTLNVEYVYDVLRDENGDPWASLEALKTWLQDNTGFNSAGGGSSADTVTGWGFYDDSVASNQTIGTTPVAVQIDALGAQTYTGQLPLDIRGVDEFWMNDRVHAINSGDSYEVRLDLTVVSKTSNPNHIDVIFDIGGGTSPSLVILSRRVFLNRTIPFSDSSTTSLFVRDTFALNGCQIFLQTDSGSVDLSNRAVLIKRDHKTN